MKSSNWNIKQTKKYAFEFSIVKILTILLVVKLNINFIILLLKILSSYYLNVGGKSDTSLNILFKLA